MDEIPAMVEAGVPLGWMVSAWAETGAETEAQRLTATSRTAYANPHTA